MAWPSQGGQEKKNEWDNPQHNDENNANDDPYAEVSGVHDVTIVLSFLII